MKKNQLEEPLVSVQCLVYNHEPYLRKCLDGLVMQKTHFPFEIIVHDDVSTDHSVDIIKEYESKYPDIVKPIYEKENQYSKGDGRIIQIMNVACKGKYIALCEGDDYWTDPLKLQKQVDFLESHPEYSMVCCRTELYSERRKKIIGEVRTRIGNGSLSPKLVILKGGLYIATVSVIYKKDLRSNDYPSYCIKCHVGDYPLQIMGAMKGGIYYFDEPMAVYRVENPKSWVGRSNNAEHDLNVFTKRIKGVKSELEMLKGFANDYPTYKKIFLSRINFFMNAQLHRNMQKEYYEIFKKELKAFLDKRSFLWKIDGYIRMKAPHLVSAVYRGIAARTYLKNMS